MDGFNIWALDKDFNLVSLLYPLDVQWTRKFHEAGTFSISLLVEHYDTSFAYVYSPERPEFGRITQVNYQQKQGYYEVFISGLFLESELMKMPVYPWAQRGNISSQPSWREYTGAVENVAVAYFEGFKQLRARMLNGKEINANLGIVAANSKGRGRQITVARQPMLLSDFLYQFLYPEGMSYRVTYDFENNQRIFEVVQGRNLSSGGHSEDENQVVLSSVWGNVKDINLVLSETEACNASLAYGTRTNAEFKHMWVENISKDGDPPRYVVREKVWSFNGDYANAVWDGSNPNDIYFALTDEGTDPDFPTTKHTFPEMEGQEYEYRDFPFANDAEMARHYNGLAEEVANKQLTIKAEVKNVDFGKSADSYEYMVDYDLGDLISVDIPEIGFSEDLRITTIYETMSGGKWNIELELGEPLKEVKK